MMRHLSDRAGSRFGADVDFFTPMVDDPFTFGAIAAANALSDVYAMGGQPMTALSILAWPAGGDLDALEQILKGGAEKIHEAGCVILGGHSVNDPEIKFGYAITGTVASGSRHHQCGCACGRCADVHERIGTGVISTALKLVWPRCRRRSGGYPDDYLESGRSRSYGRPGYSRTHGRHRFRTAGAFARNGDG